MQSEKHSRIVRLAFTAFAATLIPLAVPSVEAQTFQVFYSFMGKVGAGPDGTAASINMMLEPFTN
jgi:hypothetical protein